LEGLEPAEREEALHHRSLLQSGYCCSLVVVALVDRHLCLPSSWSSSLFQCTFFSLSPGQNFVGWSVRATCVTEEETTTALLPLSTARSTVQYLYGLLMIEWA
jgi:hypothetical protein